MTLSPLRLGAFLLLTCLLAWIAFDYQGDLLQDSRRERDDVQAQLDLRIAAADLAAQQLATRDSIDTQRTEALTRALDETKRLQRAVADRDQRLLVHATCTRSAVSASAGTTSLADAGTAELTADAQSAYFTLRDELARSREMILGLQDYIRRVVLGTPAQP